MLDSLQDLWRWFVSVPHLGLWLGIAWAVNLVGLAGWIVLQKREPAATLSWVFGLAAIPVLGVAIYIVFGPQRIKRHRLRRARSRVSLARDQVEAAGAPELATLAQATSGLPSSTCTDVRLLVDGGATYDALLEAIAGARSHVHLEYYIYAGDRSGTALRDALDFVDFNSFKNQIEFAQFGKSFNNQVDATVLSKLPREQLEGRAVKLLGAYVQRSASDLPLMTPAQAEFGPAP